MEKEWSKISFLISYSGLYVFNTEIEHPFNDWEDRHVDQGFSWREGSVSFGALSNWECEVMVSRKDSIMLNDDSIRSIIVPFNVRDEGITVCSVMTDEYVFPVPKGSYELLFEAILIEPGEDDDPSNGLFPVRYELTFINAENPYPRILKADKELIPPQEFLMHAAPAI
ncbi:competence protein [Hazenella sp. IB182353]|uniref:competence protein ComJ n=1 Tax=Polycladospora coralii TaxID=2771432 RepID=UPI0017463173|nr:competence protein ComJ [Polycladospora coralii]MBS7531576.1 competence protein [Polycladospora coralii]